MEIDLIFKIAAIGIIVAVLNQLLIRSGREDQAMMTTLAGLVVVLSILVKQISVLFVTIKSLFALLVQPWLCSALRCSRHCSMQFWKSRPPPMHSCSPLGQRWCCWCGQGQASGQYFPA